MRSKQTRRNQRRGAASGEGLEIVGLKLGGDEIVDGVSWPVRGVGGGDRDFIGEGNEGPVGFVFGALFDPGVPMISFSESVRARLDSGVGMTSSGSFELMRSQTSEFSSEPGTMACFPGVSLSAA